jgi:hypothetical protein
MNISPAGCWRPATSERKKGNHVAINPQFATDTIAAAAACQSAFDAFRAALADLDEAEAAMRLHMAKAAPGIPLSNSGQVGGIGNMAIAALQARRAFDFTATASFALSAYA